MALFMTLSYGPTLSAQDISGQIRLEPPYPIAQVVKVKKKVQDSCDNEQISKSLLVTSKGGVANVVLWLEGTFSAQGGSTSGGEARSLPEQFVILDQKRCNFEPHVILIPPGARLRVLNSDPLAHDVRAFDAADMLFRIDMDTKAKPEERNFQKSGIYVIRCGLHPWMHAFAVQAAHDFYAVTNEDGTFVLKNIPSGKQTLHLWHETLGEVKIPLDVNESIQDFSYTFKNAFQSENL